MFRLRVVTFDIFRSLPSSAIHFTYKIAIVLSFAPMGRVEGLQEKVFITSERFVGFLFVFSTIDFGG